MSALERLSTGYYNSLPVSVANPGGFAGGGHVVNFPAALADIAEVGGQIADIREAVDALVPIRAETWAVVGAFTATPDLRRVFLIDTMIDKLIDSGVWARADLLYVLAAHDEQAARINWISPGTGDLTAVNSPAFTVDEGFTGAATSYLDAGVGLSGLANYSLNDATMFVWSLTDGLLNAEFEIGTVSGTQARIACRAATGDMFMNTNSGTNSIVAVADSLGLHAWSRTSSSAAALYKNGSLATGVSATSSSVGSGNVSLLRSNTLYTTRKVAAGGVGASLSSTEHAALYDALRRYLTGVGAL